MDEQKESEPVEAEILPPEKPRGIVPMKLEELAALQVEGQEIIEARVKILETLRTASIRATHPSDWLLFKNFEGGETGYLQDTGCKRVAPLWGIDVTPKDGFERIPEQIKEGEEFAYCIRGDGHCNITGQFVRDMEGVRTSKDDFIVKQKPPVSGVMLDVRVRQAARANLDGNIVRKLAGLQAVPKQELDNAWKDTGKSTAKCNFGRGYGSAAERRGATVREERPNVQAPMCDAEGCGRELRYIPAGKNESGSWTAYWRCTEYRWDNQKKQSNGHSRISAEQWEKQMQVSKAERQPGDDA